VNTFWLVVAGLIVVIAAVYLLVLLPKLRKSQQEASAQPDGAMAILAGKQAPLIVGGIAICLFAAALYFASAKPAPSAAGAIENGQLAPEHVAMIKALSDRLEQNPNDGKGWAMLARSYAVLKRYKEALPAYEKAANLIHDDPVLLVDYADILAAANGRNLQGKPAELIQSALMLDPTNLKGLNLMGTVSYQKGDFTHAIGYWQKILTLVPPESQLAKQANKNIAIAQNKAAEQGKQPSSAKAQAATGVQISGVVKLSPALAGRVSPTDTLFVFAKAVSGPPMPVAVIRAQAKDFPQRFNLDDSMAMMPTMKLSNFKEVTVSAKISKSGNATPQSGDLKGEVATVKVGTNNVELVIDKVVP
jgi:cytochrome c-type biogenesis protein CcmH